MARRRHDWRSESLKTWAGPIWAGFRCRGCGMRAYVAIDGCCPGPVIRGLREVSDASP